MKTKFYITIIAILFSFISCSEDEIPATMDISIQLEHLMDGEALELNGRSFTLPSGEEFTPRKFNYYISNIELINSTTGERYVEPESYHFISETGKKSISLGMVPSSNYDQLVLSIGVDEVANGKTDQTGDLDPNSDMAWNWNTGYKFVVLEGEFIHKITNERTGLILHIGTNANYKTIHQEISGIRAGKSSTITLTTNLDELFRDPNTLSISDLESTTIMFGETANKVAENYSEGFIQVK